MAIFLQRPRPLPVIITAAAVLMCTALGFWQLQRRDWKHEIIASMEAGLEATPVALPSQIEDPESWDYRRVTVTGTFRHDQESYLQAQSRNGNYGFQVITPLERPGQSTVLVNRGWVPFDNKAADTRLEGQVTGTVTVSGIARKPWQQSWLAREYVFTNDLETKTFFEGVLHDMAAAHGIDVVPVFVDADETVNPGGWPKGGQTVLSLPDNHLSYAFQWFSLAIAGIVIFVLYHRRKDE